jgi:Fur family transcriptional regulator, ferric uptake regulator
LAEFPLFGCLNLIDNDKSALLDRFSEGCRAAADTGFTNLHEDGRQMIVGPKSFSYHAIVRLPSPTTESRSFRRNTQQRREIREVFERNDRPLAADEVLQLAQAKMAGLGIATVYRTIKTLADEGWLVPVAVPGAPPRYELRGKAHHHHFHCLKCRRLYELEGCLEHLGKMIPQTFQVVDHVVLIYGFCAGCRRGRKVQSARFGGCL